MQEWEAGKKKKNGGREEGSREGTEKRKEGRGKEKYSLETDPVKEINCGC